MKIKFIIFFSLITIIGFSQNTTLDSLLNILEKTKDKAQKIELYGQISDMAREESLDSAIFYKKIQAQLSEKTQNHENTANFYLDLGKLYLYAGQYDSALTAYTFANDFAKKTTNTKLLALTLHSIGNTYIYQSKLAEAQNFYLQALEIRDSINDTAGIAATTNNIGMIMWKLKNYPEALSYYKMSLDNEFKLNNDDGLASSYNNIGVLYWKIDSLDSAIFYIKKSIEIDTKINKIRKLGRAFSNLGVIYRTQELYDSATFYFNKSLKINKKIDNINGLATDYYNIATIFLRQNKYSQAEIFIDSALIISEKTEDIESQKDALKFKAHIKYLYGDYKNAYDLLLQYNVLKDSIYSENLTNQITELQTKYETEKKEQEIKLKNLQLSQQEAELKTQRKILYIFIVFFSVVLILSIFLAKLYFQKKKANELLKLKNAEISQQKEEIETQTNNLETAFKQLRQQKEQIEKQNILLKERNDFIEASIRYARTIQTASLPLQSDISKYFDNQIIYLPKDIVSGDFYFFAVRQEPESHIKKLFFVVADCTGHGVPGAFMSMIGIRLLNKYINESNINSPAEILNKLNKDINIALKQDSSHNKDGMDLIICRFDINNNTESVRLTFDGAKRDLYFFSDEKNDIQRIKGTVKSIGGLSIVNNKQIFKDKEILLSKKDIIYLFTDGIIDQNNDKRKRFGSVRLLEIIRTTAKQDLKTQKQQILENLKLWQGNNPQRDDITFIALRIK